MKRTEEVGFWNDFEEAIRVIQEKEKKAAMLAPINDLELSLNDAVALFELASLEGDESLIEELEGVLTEIYKRATRLHMESILSAPHDLLNCFVEINAGAGGTEAQDWAYMLARMYIRWAERKKYKTEITNKNDGEEAGVKSITIRIEGSKS
ncbi:MAG: PCRF domain-containing protein, partial [Holosporales bacterium]|nr:PCRF domain-containing protein [Holosporales bacterium]